MRTALVIGARGLLGSALVEALGPGGWTGTFARSPAPGLHRFDLAEAAADPGVALALIDRVDPYAVLVAGGSSSAEACEADEAAAMAEHAAGPQGLAAACARMKVPLVIFSSDAVFDGESGPYGEDAAPAPLSVLGRAQRVAEMAVLKASPRNLVVRTSWVYGPEPRGEGMAYRLSAALREGRTAPVASDQSSTPTYSRDLARAAISLAETGASGIVHVAGPEAMSAASFALMVAKRAGARPSLVRPDPSSTLRMAALRPQWGGLRCDRLGTLLPAVTMRGPAAGLDHWMGNQRGMLWPA